MPFDGTELSPVTQALITGRQRIEAGWCQGAGRRRGSVCALVAVSDSHFMGVAVNLLVRAIGTLCVGDWNDMPGRTKDDVLAAYDRAIALSMSNSAA